MAPGSMRWPPGLIREELVNSGGLSGVNELAITLVFNRLRVILSPAPHRIGGGDHSLEVLAGYIQRLPVFEVTDHRLSAQVRQHLRIRYGSNEHPNLLTLLE